MRVRWSGTSGMISSKGILTWDERTMFPTSLWHPACKMVRKSKKHHGKKTCLFAVPKRRRKTNDDPQTYQLSGVMSNIVDTNHDCTFSSFVFIGYQLEFVVQIQLFGTGELRNLSISLVLESIAHLIEDFNKAKCPFRGLFILVQNIQQGGGTSTSRTTRWIGKLKRTVVISIYG